MITQLLQLYPTSVSTPQSDAEPIAQSAPRPLKGLYLEHDLRALSSADKAVVYANFVTSLDGRIALQEDCDDPHSVPQVLTTQADWVLFQELQAQADCLVTHGGYLRALAEGRLDNILQVGLGQDNSYLLDWRERHGLGRQPAIVVASASLNFPPPPSLKAHAQPFHIVTGNHADRMFVRAWQGKGYDVRFAGAGKFVQGKPLIELLTELGYRSIYLEAGPLLLDALLRDRLLDRLYLTQSHILLGGERFHTLLRGPGLRQSGRLKLSSLYYDPASEQGIGQFFACFEPLRG